MQIVIPSTYNYVLWTALFIGFECLVVGFAIPGRKRSKVFNKEFLQKNFGEEHSKAFPNAPTVHKLGHPDTGYGLYSKKLSYRDWFEYNLA